MAGRNKKDDYNNTVKVTINDEMAEMLDDTVKITGKSKCDIIRDLIPIVSSKDFERLVPNTKIEILQNYSEKCWNILHEPGCVFEVELISKHMPAFVWTLGEPLVYVKYPTFKIQILDSKNPQSRTRQEDIKKLLKNVKDISEVYDTKADYLVINNTMVPKEFPYVCEVMCLGIDLIDKTDSKNEVVSILKNAGYDVTVYPGYCIRHETIQLLEEGKYFKIKV